MPKSSHIRPITDLCDKAYVDMENRKLLEACSNIKLELSKEDLRVIVSKNQRNGGHGQKIDFAHTLSV